MRNACFTHGVQRPAVCVIGLSVAARSVGVKGIIRVTSVYLGHR